MYTEGFDELSEMENRPPRTYVSAGGQDYLKLQRENERLKKSLEKEQFFNRLLDQELKDLKSARADGNVDDNVRYSRRTGVSRGTFNILLVITLAMAGFIAYTLLYNKQYDIFQQSAAIGKSAGSNSFGPVPAVTDSVPNIIAHKQTAAAPIQQNNAIVEKPAGNKDTKAKAKPARVEPVAAANQGTPAEETATTATDPAPAPAEQTPAERPVIAKYEVTSKANFYSAPDGNTLRSYFISPGSDKIVSALEEKNGFIYVEFKNDVGYVTKGWLSKADLTRQ